MRRHVVPNPGNFHVDAAGLDSRELAKAAARQAGLSLEEWVASVLMGRRGGESAATAQRAEPPRATWIPRREPKTAIAGTPAGSATDPSSRTDIALASMAGWIEHAEARLNETARMSADHHDRMTSVLSEALSGLKDRLDAVEHRVVAHRAAPPRVEFPLNEALQALSPITETLSGLRSDMARVAQHLQQPGPTLTPAVEGIHAEIERIRQSMDGLATRDEIASLDQALTTLSQRMEREPASRDLLTLAQSIATLHRQMQVFSETIAEGLHGQIGGEIDLVTRRLDRIAETGVDRSVIDFLSSQIVDMRHDLAHRAEPRQIASLSDSVAALGDQIADLRAQQVGRSDFAALKSSLENVCSALARTVAAQEASEVPEQLQHLSERLDILVGRPEAEPADLTPIAEQLAVMTERMAGLSSSRASGDDALAEMIDRLSVQVQDLADRTLPAHEPLMQRFDHIEEGLRQVGRQADTATIELMLRSIDEKLESQPVQTLAFDALERRIATLSDRLPQTPGEPFEKALGEATAHLKTLRDEAEGIAERAARAALKDVEPKLGDCADLDSLKQGFVELKALQSRADRKTQETLRTVHDALATLVARFSDVVPPSRPAASPGVMQPADRLEAAVRRLHAAALSQMEDIASPNSEPAAPPEPAEPVPAPARTSALAPPPMEEPDLAPLRASFIAAARRAAQTPLAEPNPAASAAVEPPSNEQTEAAGETGYEPRQEDASLFERLRKTFEGQRRPLLFSLALLILAAGASQIFNREDLAGNGAGPVAEASAPVKTAAIEGSAAAEVGLPIPASRLALAAPSILPASGKYLVDPATVGLIPMQIDGALRQAALAGDAAALLAVASMAAEGQGLAQDPTLAARLFERAAQAGLPPAQERLAMAYEKGLGVPQDPKLAATWYERAAQGGNVRAMHNLATLLASNLVGKPDYAAAFRWYNEAAQAGLRDSQFNLGVLLARGIGTKRDLVKAHQWYSLAADQGDPDAAKRRDEIAARLTPAELETAKVAREGWHPRVNDPVANEIGTGAIQRTAGLDQTAS